VHRQAKRSGTIQWVVFHPRLFITYSEHPPYGQQHYFKADAYRVKPLSGKGCFAVDGEEYPFEEYQVEVHRGLGTFLSLYGRYAVDFQSTGKDI
jgi:hypothetical protein